jgi:hypothetical protein
MLASRFDVFQEYSLPLKYPMQPDPSTRSALVRPARGCPQLQVGTATSALRLGGADPGKSQLEVNRR